MSYVVIAEHWVHGDVDAEHVLGTFATRADADAWLDSAAADAARDLGPGTEGVTLRVEERAPPSEDAAQPNSEVGAVALERSSVVDGGRRAIRSGTT